MVQLLGDDAGVWDWEERRGPIKLIFRREKTKIRPKAVLIRQSRCGNLLYVLLFLSLDVSALFWHTMQCDRIAFLN